MPTPSPDTAFSTPFPTLASRILWCAEKLGSKRKLADASGVSEAQIFRYVNGESDAPATKLLAIAQAAHVCPGWLLGGAGTPDAADTHQLRRPEYRPALMAAVVKAFTEALTEYEMRLTPLQRSRFLSFAYEVLRHEEVLRHTELSPTRGDLLEMLYYLGRESFDELLSLHEQAYHTFELSRSAGTLAPEWHEHFTNAVRMGHINLYNSPAGLAFFRRVGYTLPESARQRLLAALETVSRIFPARSNLSWLDVGCGNGREVIFLHKHRPDITFHGLDSSSAALRELEKMTRTGVLSPGNFVESDMHVIPWPDSTFDVVYSRMSLYCLPGLDARYGLGAVLREMTRVCKPGGLMLLTTAGGSGQLFMPYIQFTSPDFLHTLLTAQGMKLLHSHSEATDMHKIGTEIFVIAQKNPA